MALFTLFLGASGVEPPTLLLLPDLLPHPLPDMFVELLIYRKKQMAPGVLILKDRMTIWHEENRLMRGGETQLLLLSSNWLMVMRGLPSEEVGVPLCLQSYPIFTN